MQLKKPEPVFSGTGVFLMILDEAGERTLHNHAVGDVQRAVAVEVEPIRLRHALEAALCAYVIFKGVGLDIRGVAALLALIPVDALGADALEIVDMLRSYAKAALCADVVFKGVRLDVCGVAALLALIPVDALGADTLEIVDVLGSYAKAALCANIIFKGVRLDVYVKDGQTLELAGISLRVIATPGHTQGSCCYYAEEAGILVAGDTLFQESVGRSDFPTGSSSTLIRSVQDKLFALPDETRVYPGHGESTTIGHEKRYNPFCALTE